MKKIIFCFIALLTCSLTHSCKPKDYSIYTVACMGDSITYGIDPFAGGQMAEPYPLLLEKNMGFKKVYNYGVPGCTLSNGPNSYQGMATRIKEIDTNCNVIIVWSTGNDYGWGCPIGEIGDKDPTTYCGALYEICSFLDTNFKNAFKMFITSLPFKLDGKLYYLNTEKAAIEYTCELFKIPVLDLTNNSGFEEEIESGLNDGVHPSQEFVKTTIYSKISNFLISHL